MLRVRATVPEFNMAKAKRETQEAMFELMRKVAAKWVRRAARIPHVSGRARGAYRPLTRTLGTILPPKIPSTAKREYSPAERRDRSTEGASAQIHSLTASSVTLEISLPYIERWQDRWGNPIANADFRIGLDFEEELRLNEDAFAPINFLETVDVK